MSEWLQDSLTEYTSQPALSSVYHLADPMILKTPEASSGDSGDGV